MDDDREIRDLLIEIKTKVDILVSQGNDHEARLRVVEQRPLGNPAVEASNNDHEQRLRKLERSVYVLTTIAAVGGGTASQLAGRFLF